MTVEIDYQPPAEPDGSCLSFVAAAGGQIMN
jgi:hypothetical protein